MAVEAKAEFLGHQIAVRIAFMNEPAVKLYIDGVVVDTNTTGKGKGSIVRGVITENGKPHIVEVKRRRRLTRPRIFVDGKELVPLTP